MSDNVDALDDGLRYGSAPQRRARLQRRVEEQGFATTSELSHFLGVSEMTIRRDVQRLEREGGLRSVHGGVSALPPSELVGSQFTSRELRQADEKRSIALVAAQMVPDQGAVGLDSGTTALELARVWPAERRATVVTNSIPNVLALLDDEHTRVIMLGGELHQNAQTLSGPMTMRCLEDLRLRVVFLSASSVNERGVYCGNDFDAVIKRRLIEVADRVVLITDSSKFEGSAMVRVCGLDTIDSVVVDSGIATTTQQMLRQHGLVVHLADPSTESKEDQ